MTPPLPPLRPPFPPPTLAPLLSSTDPEADDDGELTYENVQVPTISGGASNLASSGLGDKAGTESPGRGGVFVGALCLELGSPE